MYASNFPYVAVLAAVYVLESLCHPVHVFLFVAVAANPENKSPGVPPLATCMYFPGAHVVQVPPSVVFAPARYSPGKQLLFQGLHLKAFSVFENVPVKHVEHPRFCVAVPFILAY